MENDKLIYLAGKFYDQRNTPVVEGQEKFGDAS